MTKQHAQLRDVLPPIPVGLVPLQNQLAGHIFGDKDNVDVYGILDAKDGTILKPCSGRKGDREVSFYQLIYGHYGIQKDDGVYHKDLANEPILHAFRKFMPAFYGTKTFVEHPGVVYLHLENVSCQFFKPCLADLKIGKVTWDPGAPAEKAKRESSKYPWLNEVCFQLLGMRCYREDGELLVFDRWFGRSLSPERLLTEGLGTLFGSGPRHHRRTIVLRVLEQLAALEAWFKQQRHLAIYAASLFIAFESQASIGEWGVCNGEHHCSSSSDMHAAVNGDHRDITNGDHHGALNGNGNGTLNGDVHGACKGDECGSFSGDRHSPPNGEPRSCSKEKQCCSSDGLVLPRKPTVDVRLIDFAHVHPTTCIDDNFIEGLRSLQDYLNRLLPLFPSPQTAALN